MSLKRSLKKNQLREARAAEAAALERMKASVTTDFVPGDAELYRRRDELGTELMKKHGELMKLIESAGVEDPVLFVIAPDEVDREFYRAHAHVHHLEGNAAEAKRWEDIARGKISCIVRDRKEAHAGVAGANWGNDSITLLSRRPPSGAILYMWDSSYYGHGAAMLVPISSDMGSA